MCVMHNATTHPTYMKGEHRMTQDEVRTKVNRIFNKAQRDLGAIGMEVARDEWDLGEIIRQAAQDVDKAHHDFYDALIAYGPGPS